MARKVGILAKAYYNTGTYASPTWAEIKAISDCQFVQSWQKADSPSRETPVMERVITIAELGITAKVKTRDSGDTAYTAIMAAMAAGTTLDMMFLDGDSATNGVRGVRFHSNVGSANQDHGTSAAIYSETMFEPSADRIAAEVPKYVVVATGAPTYTAFGSAPA